MAMNLWCLVGWHDYRPTMTLAKGSGRHSGQLVPVFAVWRECTDCGKRKYPRTFPKHLRR
jgi:hypothetical protein